MCTFYRDINQLLTTKLDDEWWWLVFQYRVGCFLRVCVCVFVCEIKRRAWCEWGWGKAGDKVHAFYCLRIRVFMHVCVCVRAEVCLHAYVCMYVNIRAYLRSRVRMCAFLCLRYVCGNLCLSVMSRCVWLGLQLLLYWWLCRCVQVWVSCYVYV